MVLDIWFQLAINAHNSQVYLDILKDMREMQNGVYTATLKINDGHISDYVHVINYAKSRPAVPIKKDKRTG